MWHFYSNIILTQKKFLSKKYWQIDKITAINFTTKGALYTFLFVWPLYLPILTNLAQLDRQVSLHRSIYAENDHLSRQWDFLYISYDNLHKNGYEKVTRKQLMTSTAIKKLHESNKWPHSVKKKHMGKHM